MEDSRLTAADVLDRIASLVAAGTTAPAGHDWPAAADELADALLAHVRDPALRPEHRRRIWEDFTAERDALLRERDPRLVDLVFWSEQVERLYRGRRSGRLSTFHYARALEATCRRCGYELLPALSRMEDLGRAWGGRDYEKAIALLSADLIEFDAPGETTAELGPQA